MNGLNHNQQTASALSTFHTDEEETSTTAPCQWGCVCSHSMRNKSDADWCVNIL